MYFRTIDKVDDTMEEIREQMDLAEEINNAIASPLGADTVDEDDLLAELDQLEQENLDEQLLGTKVSVPTMSLPSAPTKGNRNSDKFEFFNQIIIIIINIIPAPAAPSKKVVDEDAELAALEASMA
jgi:hypothetical protein